MVKGRADKNIYHKRQRYISQYFFTYLNFYTHKVCLIKIAFIVGVIRCGKASDPMN